MKTLMKVLLLLLTLVAGQESATAQTESTFTKWKQVQDPSTLSTNDVVVIVDLTTSNAMRNNPEYEGDNTVSKAAPPAMKVTLKEEQDRIISEFGDTIVWTADRTDGKYSFKLLTAEGKTRYLFDSDQNLRVGFVSEDNASKRKFDLDKGLLYKKIQTDENVYKDYHIGLKVATGIEAMMGGNTWELMADSVNGEDTYINKEIAATKMAFFKKVVTTLPDPTVHFPGHDYEADVIDGSFASPEVVVDEDPEATITFWSSNEDLAEVDASSGVVTLKKRGTVRIYAQVAATDSYDDCLTSYILRIDDTSNNVKGCRTNPFTVDEAIAYAKAEGHEEETANGVCYFVSGIVSSVGGAMAGMEGMEDMMDMMTSMMGEMEGFDMSAMLSMFMGEQEPGTVTYAISGNGVNRDSLSVINGRGLLLDNMFLDITEDSLSVGDWVTVYGPLDYSEDNDMMSMFGGGNKEKTVKMPRINYMSYHKRNLITEDINLYYEQQKTPEELFSITDTFGGTLVTKDNAGDTSKPYTTLTLSDKEIANWVVTNETDSVLTPKKEGIITIKVKAPVLLANGDTIYMERRFKVDVRDRQLQAAGTMVGNYELVTDESQLVEGDKLIVVATIDNKPKVLVKSSGSSGGIMDMLGGGASNAKDVTIESDGTIKEIPDITQILTLEQADGKWLLQTGRTADYQMTYLYVSDPASGGSTSMIPGMGSSGAKLTTGTLEAIGDSCQVSFTFLQEKNDSVMIQFNFDDREDGDNTVTAKNVIRYENGMMSTSFGGFEPESDKATLPQLYRLVQADQYTVTIGNALWATIVSSYDVTLPDGLTGYVVKKIDDAKNQAILQEVTDQGGLKAGTPYLLNAASVGTYTLTKADTDISVPEVNLLEISNDETGNGVYVLANKGDGAGFYKWTGGLLGAGRVYLQKSIGSNARSFISFGFDNGTTTSLSEELGVKSEESAGAWYDLQGRRMDGQRSINKGVYILDGKKIIIK